MTYRMTDLPTRLQSRIMPSPDGCWLWTGALSVGYGSLGGSNALGSGSSLVHRTVYELLVGPIPAETPVLHHRCEQRACSNPLHLEPTTQMGNMRYAAGYKGGKCPNGHIPDEDTGCRLCHKQLNRARSLATSRLKDRHPEEYAEIYAEILDLIRKGEL